MRRLLAAILCLFTVEANAACQTGALPFNLQEGTTAHATDVMANFNQIVSGVAANCAGKGANSDITSLTGLTTPLTYTAGGSFGYIGGTSGGAANAQTIAATTPIGFTLVAGKWVVFQAGFTNTGAATLNVNTTGVTAINRLGRAGPEALVGGEIVSGNTVVALYDGTRFVLINYPTGEFGAAASVASSTTTNLATNAPAHNALITGTVTITSFGSGATTNDPIYFFKFNNALTLTHNATSLILPGGGNITTAANDTGIAEYLGSGNWLVRAYQKANGSAAVTPTPMCGATGLTITAGITSVGYVAAQAVMISSTNNLPIYATSISGTINLTTGGAGTSTADGMDGTARAASNFTYIHLINNGTTTAGLGSASATAPALPAGYGYACRVGAVNLDGSSNTYRTVQKGSWTYYLVIGGSNTTAIPTMRSGASGTCAVGSYTSTTATGAGVFAPTTATHLDVVANNNFGAAALGTLCVAPSNSYGTNTSTNPPPIGLDGGLRAISVAIFQLESANVFYADAAAGGWLGLRGWKDAVNAN